MYLPAALYENISFIHTYLQDTTDWKRTPISHTAWCKISKLHF